MVLLYILALIGEPLLVAGGVAIGLLARRRLHLLAAGLLPMIWFGVHGLQHWADTLPAVLIVSAAWATAAFLVKSMLRAQ